MGHVTRPRKWFTRQTRVSHWNERDSMLTSVTAKPPKFERYSSSGMQGSPTPPLWQPCAKRANGDRKADSTTAFRSIIVEGLPESSVRGRQVRPRTRGDDGR